MQRLWCALWLCAVLASCGAPLPERTVTARVISITPRLSRWHTDEVVMTLRSDAGLTATRSILISRLTCSIGDSASVKARGTTLILDDHTCARDVPFG